MSTEGRRRYMGIFGGGTRVKKTLRRPTNVWKDIIKMDLQKIG